MVQSMFTTQCKPDPERTERGFFLTAVERHAGRCETHRNAQVRAANALGNGFRRAQLSIGAPVITIGAQHLAAGDARQAFEPRHAQLHCNRDRHPRLPAGAGTVVVQHRAPAPQVVDKGLNPASQRDARGLERLQLAARATGVARVESGGCGDHAEAIVV